MNKKILLLFLLVVSIVLFLSSCSQADIANEAQLHGVWVGADEDGNNTLAMKLNDDGTARLAGSAIEEDGLDASYTWYVNDYHLEINSMLFLYSTSFAFELDTDETSGVQTLTLYTIAQGMMNSFYDSFYVERIYVLTKQPEDTLFSQVIANL